MRNAVIFALFILNSSLARAWLYLTTMSAKGPVNEPNKPRESLYYIHGWQGQGYCPETFEFQQHLSGEVIDLAEYAAENHHELKALYWPEAIGPEVRGVQHKLWQKDSPAIIKLEEQLLHHLNEHGCEHPFRLIGHSLGAQAAVLLAYRLHEQEHQCLNSLQRITLLDPAFLKSWRLSPLKRTIKMIQTLKQEHSLLFDCYQSSEIVDNNLIGERNRALRGHLSFIRLKPRFLPFFAQAKRHSHAKNFYFLSLSQTPKTLEGHRSQCAQSSQEETAQNDRCFFEQVEGLSKEQPELMIFSKQCPDRNTLGNDDEPPKSRPAKCDLN